MKNYHFFVPLLLQQNSNITSRDEAARIDYAPKGQRVSGLANLRNLSPTNKINEIAVEKPYFLVIGNESVGWVCHFLRYLSLSILALRDFAS